MKKKNKNINRIRKGVCKVADVYEKSFNSSQEWKPYAREFYSLIDVANEFGYQAAYEYIDECLLGKGYDYDAVHTLFNEVAEFEYVVALGHSDADQNLLDLHIAKRLSHIFD